MKFTIFSILTLTTLSKCSLLEMSQMLWSRLLAGGIAKVESLDPLRVPLIKVDQSEGNTSYRLILRNVEVAGLNFSTLESVHIARGRLKSNLSELEAGYVSYSDLKDLDSIRYRFHTLVKEPRIRNRTEEVELSSHVKKDYEHYQSTVDSKVDQRPTIDSTKNNRKYVPEDPLTGATRSNEYSKSASSRTKVSNSGIEIRENDEVLEDEIRSSKISKKIPANIHVVHAGIVKSTNNFDEKDLTIGHFKDSRGQEEKEEPIECFGNCNKRHEVQKFRESKLGVKRRHFGEREEDAVAFASQKIETKKELPVPLERKLEGGITDHYNNREGLDGSKFSSSLRLREHERHQVVTGEDSSTEDKARSNDYDSSSIVPLERESGYVDVVYADGKDKKMKHFKHFGTDTDLGTKFYDIKEVMKNLRESRRYFACNLTEGESLTSRYNKTKFALRSKMLKDLIRYAENFQEKQGYFEQGMQLIYHFGGMDPNKEESDIMFNETKRKKREHLEEVTEDDVMHVILRIRVPQLQTKAEYVLTGKVGEEILRGNGLFIGNFTELVGDFTIELKKVNEDLMIVRAARAKLVSKDRKIDFQGMDEKGPVASILVHGLMAAEAVAAMLADDLATKTLSKKSAEGTIYKMYKNLPIN